MIATACSEKTTTTLNGGGGVRKRNTQSLPQNSIGQSSTGQSSTGQNPIGQTADAQTQMFNAAILTKSVECLFCHMKIEGDVGGIDFPSNAEMHKRAGEGFRILGTLYGTNQVPDKLASMPQAKNARSFYQNSELKIFPTTRDKDGKITFPVVSKNLLQGKTKGTLQSGSVVTTNYHSGSLTLMGVESPIKIDGEVFIDGDLIIGGNYSGLGTIYARNIFIVRDLKASISAFPYPTDRDAAKKIAQEKIKAKTDGLYMMALGQITVGYPDPKFIADNRWKTYIPDDPSLTNSTPSKLTEYVSLAESKNCSYISEQHDKTYSKVIVNQVDAFLYAANYLLWRTCNGFVLNGGFIAPNVALVNAGDALAEKDSEPSNVVRYDYRLRAGVNAFSILRQFFEKE